MVAFNCHGCTKRYAGCHAACELYKADKAEYERVKALENRNKEHYKYIAGVFKNGRDSAAKHHTRIKDVAKF